MVWPSLTGVRDVGDLTLNYMLLPGSLFGYGVTG
jgi:hypothetical protein